MELTILTKQQFDQLALRLDQIIDRLSKMTPPRDEFIDNARFISLMKISKRTAQTWRDEGLISFSQIGNKIYYNMSDVEALMRKHHFRSFKKL